MTKTHLILRRSCLISVMLFLWLQAAIVARPQELKDAANQGMFQIVRPDGSPLAGADVWIWIEEADVWIWMEKVVWEYPTSKLQMDLGTTNHRGDLPWQPHVSRDWSKGEPGGFLGHSCRLAVAHADFGINIVKCSLDDLIGRKIKVKDRRTKGTFKNTHNFIGKVAKIELWPTETRFGRVPDRVQNKLRKTFTIKKNARFLFPMRIKELLTFNVKFDDCVAQIFAADCVDYFWRPWRPAEFDLPELGQICLTNCQQTFDDFYVAFHTLLPNRMPPGNGKSFIRHDPTRPWQWLVDLRNSDGKSYAPLMPMTLAVGAKQENPIEIRLTTSLESGSLHCQIKKSVESNKFSHPQLWTVDMKTGKSARRDPWPIHPIKFGDIHGISSPQENLNRFGVKLEAWHLKVNGINRPGFIKFVSGTFGGQSWYVTTGPEGTISLPVNEHASSAWLLENGKARRLYVHRTGKTNTLALKQ